MTATLGLTMTDYVNPTRWRWVLTDERGKFVADHEVRLDLTSREYNGFADLSGYLDYYREAYPPEQQLADLGRWIGQHLFGGVRGGLWKKKGRPAAPVRVVLTPAAERDGLLLRPFELARFEDGTSFLDAGLRFVYEVAPASDAPRGAEPKQAGDVVRLLAAFSLPAEANPLNLRRERYGLQQLVRELVQTRGAAVELRVLQYGATRDTLRAALEDGPGWDVVHLSCYGGEGTLLLEDEQGGADLIGADELGDLLELVGGRLKLLILHTCYNASGSHAAVRAAIGLDAEPARGEGPGNGQVTAVELPNLALALSARLDCAALAMRYPIDGNLATDLMLSLYGKLLDRRRPLPAALELALDEVVREGPPRPPLSTLTPVLVGTSAAGLRIEPPAGSFSGFTLPTGGLGAFPPEPPRFVGRLRLMLRASQALAPRGGRRGVLFYGMPGAGKTTCALELAYRHAEGRFRGYVWYQAPEAGSGVTNALFDFLFKIETQLEAPDLGLTTSVDEPERFRRLTLPCLQALLERYSLLLVLDNVETLLTESGAWRDPLWGDTVEALLGHDGWSRTVLTSQRAPAGMERDTRVQVEAVHALSLAESVLLARELPNLARLFGDEEGRGLLQGTLRLAQGHPRLLELADGLAADRAALAARLAAAADETTAGDEVLDAFFAADGTREGETRQDEAGFVRELQAWTAQVVGGLAPEARLLLEFLCRLEVEDRQGDVVEMIWPRFLERIADVGTSLPEQARDSIWQAQQSPEVARDVPGLVGALEAAGVVAVARGDGAMTYTVHPGVAEMVRAAADRGMLDVADIEAGNYFGEILLQAMEREMEGASGTVVSAARRAAPYLLRQARWDEASMLLEQMLHRDPSPATVGLALPLLRRIARATEGTEEEMVNAAVLATALRTAGRVAEAEPLLRDVMERAAARGEHHTMSALAGELVNVLLSAGRLGEALTAAEEKAEYTRSAGLGPWAQLADETMRLQVLAAMGQYDEVLEAVEAARPRMAALPAQGDADETANPWNVRETLLDTGRMAAVYSERWEKALSLSAEIVAPKEARGAGALEMARTRFSDYGPLLSLGRLDEARALLIACRAVFEAERDIEGLGKVFGALAAVEDESGHGADAVQFEQAALGYKYRVGEPESCATSHHGLAIYLERQGARAEDVLAQRLAAGVIWLQTQSGLLPTTLVQLAGSDLPPLPPTFDDVATRVEVTDGVRFRELFARLPRTAPDGDAAIAALWAMVEEEKRRVMQQFEPLLRTIAATVEDDGLRAQIEPALAQEEKQGWMLMEPAQRIWAGERDVAALTTGIDGYSALLVRRVLELLDMGVSVQDSGVGNLAPAF